MRTSTREGRTGARRSKGTARSAHEGPYPRVRPLVAIDQILVRAPWSAARAEVLDPGFGRHRAVVADLVRLDGAGRD